MFVAPPNIKKCLSAISLEAPPCLLPVGFPVWHQWTLLFFPLLSLSFLKNYSLVLLVIDISTLVLIFFISNFWFWSFYRSLIYLQFHSSISIYHILYSPTWSSFFGFLFFIIGLIVKF